ncbi:MAG: hypothetical protein AAB971_04305 [Patescibacteria group bacterium]
MTDTSFQNGPELLDVLRDETVREHIAKMFEVGTGMCQESAFAVYSTDDQPKYEVSELVIPDIDDIGAAGLGDFNEIINRARSVDPVALTRRVITPHLISKEEPQDLLDNGRLGEIMTRDLTDRLSHELSPQAQRKLGAVLASPDIDEGTRLNLIEAIEQADRNVHEDQNVRSDIFLLAHNHPQPPGPQAGWVPELTAAELIVPSPPDISGSAWLARHNPRLIEMIVAASRRDRKAMLYAAAPGGQIDPGRYEAAFDTGSRDAIFKSLPISGLKHVVVDLTKTGRLTMPNQNRVRRFSEELA